MKPWVFWTITGAATVGAIIFIKRHEIKEVAKKILSRGYRNNNPGNLDRTRDAQGNILPFGAPGYRAYKGEIAGTDSRFRTFSSMEYGYRAMFSLLYSYIKRGEDTIQAIIDDNDGIDYAPSVENNSDAYVSFLEKYTGIPKHQKISISDSTSLKKLVAGISHVENGFDADKTLIEKGFKLI